MIEIQQYFGRKKEVYNALFKFIESNDFADRYFDNLIKIVQMQEIQNTREEFEKFILLILNICNNHYKHTGFLNKLFQVLLYFQNDIKHHFSNFEIYNIFMSNKAILLFLIQKQILIVDERIANYLFYSTNYEFFWPEIKPFISKEKVDLIEKVFKEKNPNFFDSYEEKRRIGENDSYICTIIRKDLISEFVQYMTRTNISYKEKVTPSIFETNSYLLENDPNLIEYATFFGSIKIIQYMNFKGVDIEPNLINYAIHSNNAKLVHTLEEFNLDFCNESCLIESIKCHHNNFANYILNHFYPFNSNKEFSYNERLFSSVFQYHNYAYLPYRFSNDYEFYYLCFYKFFTLVDLYMKTKEKDIELQIIIFFVFLSNFILQFNSISNSI